MQLRSRRSLSGAGLLSDRNPDGFNVGFNEEGEERRPTDTRRSLKLLRSLRLRKPGPPSVSRQLAWQIVFKEGAIGIDSWPWNFLLRSEEFSFGSIRIIGVT